MSIEFLLGVYGRQRRATTLPQATPEVRAMRKELTRHDWEELWKIVLAPEEFAKRKEALDKIRKRI